MNPLYRQMNTQPINGMEQIMQRFERFRNGFRGNPQQMVQEMLNSGKVTQEQYNRAVQMANQMMKYIK